MAAGCRAGMQEPAEKTSWPCAELLEFAPQRANPWLVAIMVTLCCALMVHVRARPVDLGNLVFDAPNRLDVTDLFMPFSVLAERLQLLKF